ncbi:TPA: hypothetical protein ACQWGN_000514 [Neisseria subflava]
MNHFKKNKQKQLRSLLLLKSSEEKEKARFIDYLEIIGKFFAALAALGLILGSFLTHRYLDFIEQSSIFPDAMTSSSSLTTSLFVFALILIVFIFPFVSPYFLLNMSSEYEKKGKKLKKLNLPLYALASSFPILITLLIIMEYFGNKDNLPIHALSILTLTIPCIFYLLQENIYIFFKFLKYILPSNNCFDNKKQNIILKLIKFIKIYFFQILYTIFYFTCLIFITVTTIPLILILGSLADYNYTKERVISFLSTIKLTLFVLLILLFISFTMFFYPFIFIILAYDWIPNGLTQYMYLYCLSFFIFLNIKFVADEINKSNSIKGKNISVYTLPIFLSFLSFLLLLFYSNNSAIHILYPVRFVEIPKNSSWYLLHNNFQHNNGTQEINGIDKNDLFKLKQKFKCSALSEKEKVKKGISCSSIPEQRNNALYGYMAWNLGDTKVFCPPTAENNKGKKEAAKLATECIVISGKFLQILNKNYIDIMPKER